MILMPEHYNLLVLETSRRQDTLGQRYHDNAVVASQADANRSSVFVVGDSMNRVVSPET